LDVRGNSISSLPATVVQLVNLMYLHIDESTRVPNGIGNLKCLEHLFWLRLDESTINIVAELGQLTELRRLRIQLDDWYDNLLQSLCKLQKIQELEINGHASRRSIGGLDAWLPPRHLRALRTSLTCWFSALPAWKNPLLLRDLSSISIAVRELHQVDLELLGLLPALRFLGIEVDNKKLGILRGFVVAAGSFRCLVRCSFQGFVWPVVFQQAAMPRLRELRFWSFYLQQEIGIACSNGSVDLELGLGNLSSLQEIMADLRCQGTSKEEAEQAKAALRRVAEIHPNHPRCRVSIRSYSLLLSYSPFIRA
jgi:hypothetical protein